MVLCMQPDETTLYRMTCIDWFRRCGLGLATNLHMHARFAPNIAAAITSAHGSEWKWVGTEAQGDLTAYLASKHSAEYCDWNRLGDNIEEHLKLKVMPAVNAALTSLGAESLSDTVLLDLTRIALWSSYKKHFRNVPDFFRMLFIIYDCGHLPCGWDGEIESWPEGRFVIY